MTPLASVADLEKRLGIPVGDLAGEDLVRAQTALEDASTVIRAETGRDFPDPATVPPVVALVALQLAKRAWLNPEDVTSESVGEYSSARSVVGLYLTRAERLLIATALRRVAGSRWSGTGSIGVRSAV